MAGKYTRFDPHAFFAGARLLSVEDQGWYSLLVMNFYAEQADTMPLATVAAMLGKSEADSKALVDRLGVACCAIHADGMVLLPFCKGD